MGAVQSGMKPVVKRHSMFKSNKSIHLPNKYKLSNTNSSKVTLEV